MRLCHLRPATLRLQPLSTIIRSVSFRGLAKRGASSGGSADQREYEPVKSTSSQLCRYHDGTLFPT